MADQPPFLVSLADEPAFACQVGFALYATSYVEEAGLVLAPERPSVLGRSEDEFARFPHLVAAVAQRNPHLLPFFARERDLARLAQVHASAWHEMRGWLRSQQLALADPHVLYELGALALGVELPPILIGELRGLNVGPNIQVAELPNSSGYPTVLLAGLQPAFEPARRARLYVDGWEAEVLAAWAMTILTRQLSPVAGAIVRVTAADRDLLRHHVFDVALAYNLVPWLRQYPERSVVAQTFVLL